MPRRVFLFAAALLSALLALTTPWAAQEAKPHGWLMYVGTYTGEASKGIYAFRYDQDTGAASPLGLAAETRNPTFLAVHPSRKFIYAANEIGDFDAAGSGSVSAFSIDGETGKLALLNRVSSRGGGTCHITLDRTGGHALVANYGGGSVAVLPIAKDGRLREASAFVQHAGPSAESNSGSGRQKGPHAHSIDLSPDQRFSLAADLGLDQILVYRYDRKSGALVPNDPAFARLKPGMGPRHVAIQPGGRRVYVISELASQVTVFAYDRRRGRLDELQSLSTLPKVFEGENYTAEIAVHPSGRFVYGSNRGHNSIAVFLADPVTGKLTFVETVPTGGRWPRHFEIDPTGRYLFAANQNSGDIFSFRIDPETGRLAPTGQVLHVPSPVCIKFVAVN